MARERGNVGIGEKDGHIVTSFVPPLYKSKLFEATTSALSIVKVIYDDREKIKGVIYQAGDPESLDQNLDKLREEGRYLLDVY